ncbi:uncharacterized protein M6G45_017646 [Spheniscus humboldti]
MGDLWALVGSMWDLWGTGSTGGLWGICGTLRGSTGHWRRRRGGCRAHSWHCFARVILTPGAVRPPSCSLLRHVRKCLSEGPRHLGKMPGVPDPSSQGHPGGRAPAKDTMSSAPTAVTSTPAPTTATCTSEPSTDLSTAVSTVATTTSAPTTATRTSAPTTGTSTSASTVVASDSSALTTTASRSSAPSTDSSSITIFTTTATTPTAVTSPTVNTSSPLKSTTSSPHTAATTPLRPTTTPGICNNGGTWVDGRCKCPLGFRGDTCDHLGSTIETNAGRKSFLLGFIQCRTKSAGEGATVGAVRGVGEG